MTTAEKKVNYGEPVRQQAIDYIYDGCIHNGEPDYAEMEKFADEVLEVIDSIMGAAGYWCYVDQTGEAIYEVGTDPKEVNFDAAVNYAIAVADENPMASDYEYTLFED